MKPESENEQDARVEQLWRTLDVEHKGHVDVAGLRRGLKKMDHPLQNADEMLRDVMDAVDSNKDGRIEYHEFHTFVRQAEMELWRLFKSIDHDDNGKLDRKELQQAFLKAGLTVSKAKLSQLFDEVDTNRDGVISFDEWRDFLLFMPAAETSLHEVLSYYQNSVKVNPEGDVLISDDTIQGLGYFLAGGVAGIVSRTATAPLDRLKVYLIAQTNVAEETVQAAKSGAPVQAVKGAGIHLINATKDLWRAGGMRSLYAGNGLNVVKVMPESAIKFGSYEAAKRVLARFEGVSDTRDLHSWSRFVAGGASGLVSQFFVYPIDTLKFRMQCETVEGGLHGNRLIIQTVQKMWVTDGFRGFFRGLPMGLVGMFPYAAIDLGTFEYLKRAISVRKAKKLKTNLDDPAALPSSFATATMGAFSGALGASLVYPLNLLRTRLQSQGTVQHPRRYTGIVDVTRQTIRGEGVRGLFKGITPNLLKVVPAVSITYVVYEKSKQILNIR